MLSTAEKIEKILKSAGDGKLEFEGNVLFPADFEECKKILLSASENHLKIRIAGKGSQIPYPEDMIIVSTVRLSSDEKIDEANSTLTIGAGSVYTRLTDISTQYMFNLPEYMGTIGGCLAGSKSLESHFELQNRVLSMKCILSSGQIVEFGSESVKDVAGYRIAPLFFGSMGRLGIIAGVTLNLAPMVRAPLSLPSSATKKVNERHENAVAGKILRAFDPEEILA